MNNLCHIGLHPGLCGTERRLYAIGGHLGNKLKSAQRAWLTFRDAQCRYEAGVYDGGSIAPLVHSSCLTNLTEQRTKDLIALLDQP
ncbi:lysozyme inhibitor LprI family protein [Aeromonas sp. BIGb0445]|uniref:lysozyme inhibitor LprI family protein n=1 Tax=Aeromonas sp. BIGb0445 TaxID=2940593 RepID=UPI0021673692|nr:lysozyme inhibitor LprI family protein [Aeromonas sp. BIGb0445]